LNLAQCEDQIGMFASAAQHYQETLDLLAPGDPRIAVAKAGLASAKKRAPKLTVRLPGDAPPGTVVLRDGVELGDVSIGTALPIDPGEHTLTVKAPGRKQSTQTVTMSEGDSKEVAVELGAVLPEPKPETVLPLAPSGSETDTGVMSESKLPYILGGIGVVVLGAGGYFVWQGEKLDDEARDPAHFGDSDEQHPTTANNDHWCDKVCYDKTQDSRKNTRIGYGFLAAGGLLVAGGAAMILLAPSGETSAAYQPSVNVAIGPDAVGAQFGGAW
jgi:hypothetical protein